MCNEVYNFVAKISKVEGFKREKIWIRTGYFFFFLSSALRVLLFFSFSPAAAPTRSLAPTHLPLRKPVKLDDFCLSFLVQKPDLELRNLPPCREFPDLLCSVLHRRLLLLCGGELLWFLNCRQLLPLPGPVLQLENCGMWQLL
ncbi:hypothetical protein SLEP1_g39462 [Rubroshorea leprosula]|uniref:Uncharacterized protein n=1 Tax=Rubroshorea leprosula TaxID=152421 RepID=A0AAV5L0A0_9ROSI|nr:hypothetical protein SLEP1_g39462 [Rubroshorea leprosula]